MQAVHYVPGQAPQTFALSAHSLGAIAHATGTSKAQLVQVDLSDLGPELRFHIYQTAPGEPNELAELEGMRLTGEWCEFNGSYCMVYEDADLFTDHHEALPF